MNTVIYARVIMSAYMIMFLPYQKQSAFSFSIKQLLIYGEMRTYLLALSSENCKSNLKQDMKAQMGSVGIAVLFL
jgi:hypothetical protein